MFSCNSVTRVGVGLVMGFEGADGGWCGCTCWGIVGGLVVVGALESAYKAYARMYIFACVRACVCACVRACVRTCVCV